MARSGDQTSGYDTASTQFFIVIEDSTFLDNYYANAANKNHLYPE